MYFSYKTTLRLLYKIINNYEPYFKQPANRKTQKS